MPSATFLNISLSLSTTNASDLSGLTTLRMFILQLTGTPESLKVYYIDSMLVIIISNFTKLHDTDSRFASTFLPRAHNRRRYGLVTS